MRGLGHDARALPLTVLLLALVVGASAAGAGEAERAALDRWLEAVEVGESQGIVAPPAMAESLRGLEREHAARQAEFRAIASRPLPPKALARLQEVEAAWEAGQGRLVELLRLIRREVASGEPETGALAAEARQILGRLSEASRRQPLSAELKLRAPELRPAALPAALPTGRRPAGPRSAAEAAAPLVAADAPPTGHVPARLQGLADDLGGPLEIYDWVRNAIAPEFYHGVMKGPLQTWRELSGNDADTAGLLVALLRAKGVPARYVRGRVRIGSDRLLALTGTTTAEQAIRVLARAGIPHEPVVEGGGVAAVDMTRVWAEAYLPYVNYRGAAVDTQGKVWVPLDPGFKTLGPPVGVDVVATLGFDPEAVVDEYLAGPSSVTPLELARLRATELLGGAGLSYEEALNDRSPTFERLGLLPNTLPYEVTSRPEVSFDPFADLAHEVRLLGTREGVTLLDVVLEVPEVMGRRFTLGYVPFDADDSTTIASFGSLSRTPPYLIEVRPVLKVDGVTVAAGEGPVGAGVAFDLKIELSHPGGVELIENQVLAGNLTAIGLGGRDAAGAEGGSDHAAAILARIAWRYLDRWNRSDAELANLLRVAPVRPTVSACMVMSAFEVDYAGGDPLYPATFVWKGLAIDADLRSSSPVGVEAPEVERGFVLLSGLEGSALEDRIFQDEIEVEAVSTARALQLAPGQGVPVLDLGPQDVEGALPGLPLDPVVKEEIRAAALRGYEVRVPAADVTRLAWTGVGYRILDPETGEAAWQLQGGHSGGVTAPSTLDWPGPLIETFLDQGEAPTPPGADAAYIRKFRSRDYQDGYVNEVLGQRLKVLVTDVEGQRIPGAPVVFHVTGGGGFLIDPVSGVANPGSLTVYTNERGEAEADLKLGESTHLIPRYICFETGGCSVETQTYATQVGLNLVSAQSGAAVLPEPFYAYGRPDDRHEDPGFRRAWLTLVKYPDGSTAYKFLRVAGLTSVLVTDDFGNPVSNFRVQFKFSPPPELGTPDPGWVPARPPTDTPGLLLGIRDFNLCAEKSNTFAYGECAGEAALVTVPSSTRGSFAYPILGDSQYTNYYFDIGTSIQPEGLRFGIGTWGRLCFGECGLTAEQPGTWVDAGGPVQLVNAFGTPIEAYPPGATVPLEFTTSVIYEGYEVYEFTDEEGEVHYRVRGDNKLTRETWDNADVFLRPGTEGTGVSSSEAEQLDEGLHQGAMVLSQSPLLNWVEFRADIYPDEFKYKGFPNLDKARVEFEQGIVHKWEVCDQLFPGFPPDCKRRDWPWVLLGDEARWGVRPTITAIQPSTIRLRQGSTAQQSLVAHTVEPPEYLTVIDNRTLRFDLRRGGEEILSATGTDGAPYTIPPGLKLPADDYTAHLTLQSVSVDGDGQVTDIPSEPVPVTACEQLDLLTPVVALAWAEDAPEESRCAADRIRFRLCESSRVTATVGGTVFPALINGVEGLPSDIELPAGLHEIQLSRELLQVVGPAGVPFQVRAVTTEAPAVSSVRAGIVKRSDQLLDLLTPRVEEKIIFDPDNRTTCTAGRRPAVFTLCSAAAVTFDVDGEVLTAIIDGNEQTIQDLVLAPGQHEVIIPDGLLEEGFSSQKPFTVAATSVLDPAIMDRKDGVIAKDVQNRSMLQVGHTIVKGVDVFTGHLVVQERDIDLPGRHLGLGVTRSYSSNGQGREGLLGAGWNWNYESSLLIDRTCGLYSLRTADGSSQVFRQQGGTLQPQKGYHGRLVETQGGGFDYFDKANVRHHFGTRPTGEGIPGKEFRLEYIEEPHGDRITLEWAPGGRVVAVTEDHAGVPVRRLEATYTRAGNFERIESIEVFSGEDPLKLKVDYQYDELGNLKKAIRSGQNIGGPRAADRVQEYSYSITNVRDPHQLLERKDPNGHSVRYDYYQASDPFPGQETGLLAIQDKEEFVKRVIEFPQGAQTTSFSYDFTKALSDGEWHTVVTDPRGIDTRYVQNGLGGSIRIVQAETTEDERTTEITWKPSDVVKESETDAKGRLTRYDYDSNGNLITETIETTDLGDVVTQYAYHPLFTKLTLKTDAEGRSTSYSINETTGDLDNMRDAEGNLTVYGYTPEGLLSSETSPRGYTTLYQDHDSFGNARVVVDPLGNRTDREYDARGRLVRETDSFGRVSEYEYDGLDRQTIVRRIAGGASDDEVTATTYHPNGEPRQVTNPNRATTTFTLDGLNRVRRTDTVVDNEHLITETTYDGNGNKQTETDRRGVKRRFEYDDVNQVTAIYIDDGPAPGPRGVIASFDYDEVGNKLYETDVSANRTDYEYDGLYREKTKLLPESGPGGRYTEVYGYDLVGNRTSFTDPNGHTTTFRYDGLDRMVETIRDPGGLNLVTTSTYSDPEGSKVNKREDFDGQRGLRTLYEYDEIDRETARTTRLEGEDGDPGTGVLVYVVSTDYDDAGHAMTVTDARGTPTTTRLDGLDRAREQIVDDRAGGLRLTTRTTYDGLGNTKRVVDARGNDTLSRYDGLGRLTSVIDAERETTRYAYDGEGLRTREEDRRHVVTTFEYDNLGRETSAALSPSLTGVPWSRTTEYLDAARQRIERDARNKATAFDLDGLGRVLKVTDPLGHSVSTRYDGVNKTGETDKRGNWTTFAYDAINRRTSRTEPAPFDAQRVLTRFEDASNRIVETDRKGGEKVTQLDSLSRVRSITRGGVTLESNEYDPNDNLVRMLDAEDREVVQEYDGANRVVRRIEAPETSVEGVTTFSYDENGNLLEEQDARAASLNRPFSLKRTWDRMNRVASEADGEGNTHVFDYDGEGNRVLVREPLGFTTRFEYDELGTLTKVTSPEVATAEGGPVEPTTEYRYDPARNLLEQTDANGHVVSMTYDDLNRMDTMTRDPGGLGFLTRYEYDPDGRQELVTDPRGQTITSLYDERGRVKSRTFAFAAGQSERPWRHTTAIEYTFDANDNLERIDEFVASGTDPPEVLTTTREYDALDRLLSEEVTLPDAPTVGPRLRRTSFTYYRNGLRETVTDPELETTRYTYDERHRVRTATSAFGTTEAATTEYTFTPDSLLESVEYPNGVVARHTYDLADRLRRVTNLAGATTLSAYAYDLDANGNRLSQVETNGGLSETTVYGYDALNRLTSIAYPADSTFPDGRTVAYQYDPAGNRVKETSTAAGSVFEDKLAAFDAADRLLSVTDLARPEGDPARDTAFAWDANGNQIARTVGTGPGAVTTTYEFDVRNKLVEVGQGGSILGRFQYDADGRRTKKIGEEGNLLFLYDQASTLVEYDGSGNRRARYDYGWDRLISLSRPFAGRRYYSLDGLRSTVNLTTDSGALVASYHLDAWGNYRFPAELEASTNRFGFTGHYFDTETGLYMAGARYFDPEFGRFLSEDPNPGSPERPPSLHRYMYANGNPSAYVDRDGESATAVGAVAGFFWGFGQMAGRMIDDVVKGNVTPTTEYLSIWGQNIIGGAQIGASIDVAALSGGLALPASGALGAAGFDALTFNGEAQEWGEFGKAQLREGAIGAVMGPVMSKAAPLAGALARRTGNLVTKIPGVGRAAGWVGGKATSAASWVGGKARGAAAWVAERYRPTAAERNFLKQPFTEIYESAAQLPGRARAGLSRLQQRFGRGAGSQLEQNLAQSRAGNAASRFGEYANNPAVLAAERASAQRSAGAVVPSRKFGPHQGEIRDWGAHLRAMQGPAPEGMVNPHAHHVIYKKGIGEAQQRQAQRAQEILEQFDIDWYRGPEALDWAPNVKGQHTIENITQMADELERIRDVGGVYDDIVEALNRFKDEARRR